MGPYHLVKMYILPESHVMPRIPPSGEEGGWVRQRWLLYIIMRRSFTAEYKLKVIRFAEEHSVREAVNQFGIEKQRIYSWNSLKQELSQISKKTRSRNKRTAKWPELEEELLQFVLNQRQKGYQLSGVDLRTKGRQIAETRGIQDFAGTPHWCHSFMRRNGLSIRQRTSIGQPIPNGHKKKVDSFQRFVEKELGDISGDNFGNIDEVPVPVEIVGNRAVEKEGKDDELDELNAPLDSLEFDS